MSCSEELIVDEVIDSTTSGGALRNLGVTNSLDIANGASTYSIILEAQDATGGNLLQEVRVNVGFNDIDDAGTDTTARSLFTTIPAASFNETSPTTNGLPVATFTVTLSELVGHINSTLADISTGDDFIIDFDMVLTDGRIFNADNATGDVTRTGFFSYFNSQFRYTADVGDPQRLVLDDLSIVDANELGILKSGDTDTVTLTFDREDAFVVAPTITRVSAVGATDDVIGALTQSATDADEYYFEYTAGAAVADTIEFTISGGETVAGFTMASKTLTAYIIDNAAPTISLGSRSVSTDRSGNFLNVRLEFEFEQLGADEVEFTIEAVAPAFDTQTITRTVNKGDNVIVLEFVPQIGGVALPESGLEFTVTTDGVLDLIGNEAVEVFNVSIGN